MYGSRPSSARRDEEDDDGPTPGTSRDRRSLPSRLLWRSVLGSPAAWSGSSSRGVYLIDAADEGVRVGNGGGLIRTIGTDRRMFHLPSSLRDVIVCKEICVRNETSHLHSTMQLLSHPRIVGTAPPKRFDLRSYSGRAFAGTSAGVSCMDLDRGNDDALMGGSPPRYLLVGSGGGDCSISLYDISYFGSDDHLYHSSSNQKHDHHHQQHHRNQPSATHRPIARSLRDASNAATTPEENAGGVPSGHRRPLLGVNWYPADVRGAFVSSSISGEILVWDAQNFVPVFATYAHVYAETCYNEEVRKSVSPLRCVDLPKTPEGCPHGTALLALGLGASGRGVIQLCDAFRGGSPTHELFGHEGGVNAIAWDPAHPFRLATGGEDRAVRLWDIRKAGAAACLGTLDRENEMNADVTAGYDGWTLPPRKKRRAQLGEASRMRGVESHASPVSALAFAPGGEDLISTGSDGRMHHWDLRPTTCFLSSLAAIDKSDTKRSRREMDPAVALGGRLAPTHFECPVSAGNNGKLSQPSSQRQRPSSQTRGRTSLAVVQPGSRGTATLLSTSKGRVVGHSLYGRRGKEPGGAPDFILEGHLADITCLVPVVGAWDDLRVSGVGGMTSRVEFLTGGEDSMVLPWGSNRGECRRRDSASADEAVGVEYDSTLCGRWRSRHRGGSDGARNWTGTIGDELPLEDADSW